LFVSKLELKKFRNYKDFKIEFNSNLNIIIGDNAQGKTNLLEAIYVSCFGKSFRTSNDKDLIYYNNDYNHVKLNIIKKHTDIKIEYRIHKKYNKEIKINNNSIKKLSEILGNIYVVLFSPEDIELIKGSPNIRRKFINRELSNISKKYCYNLIEYKKIIKQRNNFLKKNNKINEQMLEVFNEQLIERGTNIIISRINFLKKINSISNKIHNKLTNNSEFLRIEYLPNINLENIKNYNDIKINFINKINKNKDREKQLGYTIVGPHKDDFIIFLNDKEIKQFGSQGQQRTATLSLKLSEIELIKNETDEYPILLLDDVFSELDSNRQINLIKIFDKTQTIITSTIFDENLKNKVNDYKIIKIENGNIAGGKYD
jgi:DNA replication and repair protein RecF